MSQILDWAFSEVCDVDSESIGGFVGASAAVVNGEIYLLGGSDTAPASCGYIQSITSYDPLTNQWTNVSSLCTLLPGTQPFSQPRFFYAATVVIGNTIYIMGGFTNQAAAPVNSVLSWDPTSTTLTHLAPMSVARYNFASVVVNGQIFVMGGGNFSKVEAYNPTTNIWTDVAPMPAVIGTCGPSAAAVDGKIYIFSYMYDPLIDKWFNLAPMPIQQPFQSAVGVVDGKLFYFYLIESANNTYIDPQPSITCVSNYQGTLAYDPITDVWFSKLQLWC